MLVTLCQDEPDVLVLIQEEVHRLNHDPDALDRLIEKQNYRLSFWRTANGILVTGAFLILRSLWD